jgi:hypothetical protein
MSGAPYLPGIGSSPFADKLTYNFRAAETEELIKENG